MRDTDWEKNDEQQHGGHGNEPGTASESGSVSEGAIERAMNRGAEVLPGDEEFEPQGTFAEARWLAEHDDQTALSEAVAEDRVKPGVAVAPVAVHTPPQLREVSTTADELMKMSQTIESFRDRTFEQFSTPFYACQQAASALRGAIGDVLAGKGVKP
jgi:hypothetical protein